MTSSTMIPAVLLCYLSCICASGSQFQTVEVQSGQEVTLLCANFSSSPSQIIWFRLVNRTQPSCISSVRSSTEPASFCSGIEKSKFQTSSNMSSIFLKIKHVDLFDSGLYFCGFKVDRWPVIVDGTYVKIQEEPAETTSLTSLVLSVMIVVLTKVIIVFVVKMRQHPTESEF